mgnify:FL=1
MAKSKSIEVQVDPSEVGFDADRLELIGQHFRQYVDDAKLPGINILVF